MIIDTYQFPVPNQSAISLRFERDNPCNTTIIDHDGNIFYTVATEFPDSGKPVTRVNDGVGKLVAEWKWGDARSDVLTMRDRPQTPASAWLKKSFIPFRECVFSLVCDFGWLTECASDVKFLDDAGTEYIWKNNKPGLALQVLRLATVFSCPFQPVRHPSVVVWSTVQDTTGRSFHSYIQRL